MSKVLACIDNSETARDVLATAQKLAPTLDATVEAVHVAENGDRSARATAETAHVPFRRLRGDPLEQLAAAINKADTVGAVVGARSHSAGAHAGHLAPLLAATTNRPIVVVPPGAQLPHEIRRVLVAMKGTARSAKSLKRALRIAPGADLELVILHVDDESTIPQFSDQVQHETEAYASEFLTRYAIGSPSARLELRVGVPADEILTAADAEHPDLIALGWPAENDPGHGTVARTVLERSHVPMLLVATS
jgi:nucleotide-binding universal stress UspA family protein